MRKLMVTALVAAVVGWCASPAFAQSKMKTMQAMGTVKAVSADSLTITGAGGKEMMFSVDADTKVIAKGASTKSAEKGGKMMITDSVGTGDHVTVSYHDMSGKMHAAQVRVTTKAMTKTK